MQKLTFRERIKDTAVGLGDSLKGSQFWSSIFRPGSPFRKGYSDSPRNRSYVVMNNVLYHLHPVKERNNVRKRSITPITQLQSLGALDAP